MCSDLPRSDLSPNVIQLERAQGDTGLPSYDQSDVNAWSKSSDLDFFSSPFPRTITKKVDISSTPITSTRNCFGFVFDTDVLNNRVFVSAVLNRSDATALCKSKNARRTILGAYIVAINDHPIYTQAEAISKLTSLHDDHAVSFEITFGITATFSQKDLRKALTELELEAQSYKTPPPCNDVELEHVPSLTLNDICHINCCHY